MNRPDPGPGKLPVPAGPAAISVRQPAVEAGKAYLSENTRRAYLRDWKDFFGVEDLAQVTVAHVIQVTPAMVAEFRDALIRKGLGPGTVNRKLTSVRAFFDNMVLRGVIELNPAHPKLVRAPKKGNLRKMEALSREEAMALLQAIDRSTPEGRRDYALIMTDLHMGLRRSEVLGIKTDQFRTSGGTPYLVFRGKGEKERAVTINRDLEEALLAYAKDRGTAPGYLFPGRDPSRPFSGDMFRRIVQKHLDAAGIKKRIGTHGLRATFITHNIQAGTPLSELQRTVGHSRGETTLGYARDLESIKSMATRAMEGMNGNQV